MADTRKPKRLSLDPDHSGWTGFVRTCRRDRGQPSTAVSCCQPWLAATLAAVLGYLTLRARKHLAVLTGRSSDRLMRLTALWPASVKPRLDGNRTSARPGQPPTLEANERSCRSIPAQAVRGAPRHGS